MERNKWDSGVRQQVLPQDVISNNSNVKTHPIEEFSPQTVIGSSKGSRGIFKTFPLMKWMASNASIGWVVSTLRPLIGTLKTFQLMELMSFRNYHFGFENEITVPNTISVMMEVGLVLNSITFAEQGNIAL
ncbi:hypothetical protein TNCV_2484241 [Trichonephila clavipes]|uniref:Uncharacterized protein n=1 Tax=Trichonephila clavipes TaxID=2585209 RepID=A0A8X6VZK2_TRICX|nr:hypothetical protein TNCV_2484241 [Trichonephila clavipes]